jgi:hypothetical protein
MSMQKPKSLAMAVLVQRYLHKGRNSRNRKLKKSPGDFDIPGGEYFWILTE